MPCGCSGSKNSAPKEWVYTNGKGVQATYRTEIEARAAQLRGGGAGTIVGK